MDKRAFVWFIRQSIYLKKKTYSFICKYSANPFYNSFNVFDFNNKITDVPRDKELYTKSGINGKQKLMLYWRAKTTRTYLNMVFRTQQKGRRSLKVKSITALCFFFTDWLLRLAMWTEVKKHLKSCKEIRKVRKNL